MLSNKYGIQYGDLSELSSLLTFLSATIAMDNRWNNYAARLSLIMNERVSKSVVCWSDSDSLDKSENADVLEFENHYKAVLNLTMGKYISLIAAWEGNKETLMAEVATTTTNKNWMNDTPQIDTSSGESEDLTHLSTFAKDESTTTTPVSTPAARLAEIESQISHYWKAWSDEIIHLLHLED